MVRTVLDPWGSRIVTEVRWDGVVVRLSAVLVVGDVVEVGVVVVFVGGLFATLMFGVDMCGGLVLGVLLLVLSMSLSMLSLLVLLFGQPRFRSLPNLSQIGRGLLLMVRSLLLLTVVLSGLMFVSSGGGGVSVIGVVVWDRQSK